jgi:hypothetical protein
MARGGRAVTVTVTLARAGAGAARATGRVTRTRDVTRDAPRAVPRYLAALLGQLARWREDERLHVAHRRVDGLQQPDAEDRRL